ncbi:MAG: hypothetical protein Q7J77_10090 [Undibacterium sp.]|nr:hypothetical protein [Undibacterium sp.]
MTHTNSRTIGQILREAAHDFIDIASALLHGMMRLPLPSLLMVCLVCALFLTILPLALTLFVSFLVYKLIVFLVAPQQNQEPEHAQNAAASEHTHS